MNQTKDTKQYKQKKQQELKETLDVLDKKIEELRKKWREENDPDACKEIQKLIDITEEKRSRVLEELQELEDDLYQFKRKGVEQNVNVKGNNNTTFTAGRDINLDKSSHPKSSGSGEVQEESPKKRIRWVM